MCNRLLTWRGIMKKNLIRTCVLVVCLAMVAPAFAAEDAWTGDSGTDILWSNPDNWLIGGPGRLPSIKTVIGEYNYGVPGSNDVTLAFDAGTVSGFEVFGKGILKQNIYGFKKILNKFR